MKHLTMPQPKRLPTSTDDPRISDVLPEDHPLPQSVMPPDWETHIHPNGWVYFSHPGSGYVTQTDIQEAALHDEIIMRFQIASAQWPNRPPESEIVITDPGTALYVNHSVRMASAFVWDTVKPEARPREWQKRCEMNYWAYIKDYPSHYELPDDAEELALVALESSQTGNLVYQSESIAPFSSAESERLKTLLTSLRAKDTRNKTVLVSHILERVAENALKTGHSSLPKEKLLEKNPREPNLPLSFEPTGFKERTIALCMVLLFFGVPFNYLRHVGNAFKMAPQDDLREWKAYVQKLVKEWTDFNLVATVLLSATVAFLAVPGIDSLSRISALVSVLCALESVTIGLYLVWRHQTRKDDIGWYNYNTEHRYGFHGIAMLLSLPLVLLIWAILSFAFSVLCYSYRGFAPDIEGTQLPFSKNTYWIVTSVTIIIAVTFAVVLYSFWDLWRYPGSSPLTKSVKKVLKIARQQDVV
ncbi:hypothetical protein BOTBODRAFT_143443 [Botryobasidium botryosum FD-172 SS1]|uniref:WW domain-containing protein n=1 Tax=Botryobasidium botryosum (strain FD-172 SS1) TaxID=930990 RepID=A0A067N3W6_BOTB1|nr:hypothetical protein BOTBODRAFT_143443 [Botryobasidium botryosum FD-172 SS1]